MGYIEKFRIRNVQVIRDENDLIEKVFGYLTADVDYSYLSVHMPVYNYANTIVTNNSTSIERLNEGQTWKFCINYYGRKGVRINIKDIYVTGSLR